MKSMKCINYLCQLFLGVSFFSLPFALTSVEKDQIVVSEFMISPPIEDFDCHTPSIIEISPGKLCAVWKGGPGKGKSNVEIKENIGVWISFFKDNEWSPAEEIVSAPKSVCWNPVLVKQPNGTLILFYRVGSIPRQSISLFKTSEDGGISWSREEILPAGIVGPTKAKPLFGAKGEMICGSSVSVGDPGEEFKATACWIEVFVNDRWSKYGPIEIPGRKFGCIEPVLFWGADDNLKMVCRDRSSKIGLEGWIWIAESKDQGKTWSEFKKTNLPNPDSGVEVVAFDPIHILMIYNHSQTNRYPLSLALSQDSGNSWQPLFNIEDESGEFPSATLDSKGYVHIVYAWCPPGKSQRQIKHVVLSPTKNEKF